MLAYFSLQPDGSYTVVSGSEFVVAREATSDSQSSYFLNDKKVTFKEVGTLLRGKGIDLDHNRFLILQGEVESIAMMKPKAQSENDDGLLEYLEDIIGYHLSDLIAVTVDLDLTNSKSLSQRMRRN